MSSACRSVSDVEAGSLGHYDDSRRKSHEIAMSDSRGNVVMFGTRLVSSSHNSARLIQLIRIMRLPSYTAREKQFKTSTGKKKPKQAWV